MNFIPEISSKIKLVIFDLDGVLVDSRELHYEALNRALEEVGQQYIIHREEHLAKYDGRPTTAKLNMLTEDKGLPANLHDKVWRLKQEKTFEVINDTYKYDNRLRSLLSELKKKGLILYCASNSIFKTLQLMLLRIGILEYFDFILSCEDVLHPKPAPDVYIQCMLRSNLDPKEVMIVEDSHVGRRAALLSGAHLCPVENPAHVTLERLLMRIEHINMNQQFTISTGSVEVENVNVVVPMAATYSNLQNNSNYAGPLEEVNGRPLVKMVVDNVKLPGRYTFVTTQSQCEKFHLDYVLEAISPGCNVIANPEETPSPTHTILLAKDLINNDDPLLIVNCHQYIEWDAQEFHELCRTTDSDGVIATFTNSHPRYGYVALDNDGNIDETAERRPISNIACCGIYFWKKGSDFVKYAERLLQAEKEVSEGTVTMVYAEAVKDNLKFRTFQCRYSWQLKYPKDLATFYRARKMIQL